MEIIKSQYPKINILDWCKYCNQGWVRIIKNKYTNELYCECDEDFQLWGSPEDYKSGKYIVEDRFVLQCMKKEDPYVLASEEGIINKGWNKPINKVSLCKFCSFDPEISWISIKKNKDNGKLFCKCETCGAIWRDIIDVLRRDTKTANIKIENYEDATRDEIIAAGWDKYDDVYYIKDKIINPNNFNSTLR